MAIAPLNMPEVFRPWYSLGLTHIIVNDAVCLKVQMRRDWEMAGNTEGRPVASPPSVARPDARPGNVQVDAVEADVRTEHAANRERRPPRASKQQHGDVDTVAWPENWQKVLPAKRYCPMLWSYPELGRDLLRKKGPGCKERSACFRSIFERLSLFRGTSVFWPMAMPDEYGNMVPNVDIFLAGISLLNPKAVLLCGPEAVSASKIGLDFSHTYEERLIGGRLFILFPSITKLIESRPVFDAACEYLQSRFAEICALHQPKGSL